VDAEEILRRLQERLDLHRRGALGYMGQKSYKDEFFRLFEAAYNGDYFNAESDRLLTGDAIRDSLEERWIAPLEGKDADDAHVVMEDLLKRWDEWRYAWDRR